MKTYLKNKLSRETKDKLLGILYSPYVLRDILFCLCIGLNYRKGMRLRGLPKVQMRERYSITFGQKFTAVSGWKFNSIGVNQPVILKTVRPTAKIQIGRNVGISGCTISASESISIGNNVLIGSGCLITDSDAHPIHPEDRGLADQTVVSPVVVGDDVFIGARSIVLKGVTIGKGTVVGAGSVISKDLPSMVIAAGNPARIIKEIE